LAEVPVVMAGTAKILDAINDRSHGAGQFSSRTIRYSAMDMARFSDGPDGSDAGRPLFSVAEVQAFFQSKKIRVDRDATRMLHVLACLPNYGSLRSVGNVIEVILDACPETTLITRDLVLAALQSLWCGEAVYLQNEVDRRLEVGDAAVVAKAG
jgi:hypothetical protein